MQQQAAERRHRFACCQPYCSHSIAYHRFTEHVNSCSHVQKAKLEFYSEYFAYFVTLRTYETNANHKNKNKLGFNSIATAIKHLTTKIRCERWWNDQRMARELVLDFNLELLNERYPLPTTLASLCCINKSFVVSINVNHGFSLGFKSIQRIG